MDWCSGRIKEVSICEYAGKCDEKIDCTTNSDMETEKFPVYCVGLGEYKCMRDDGEVKMSEAVRRMTREELIAERDKYRVEADRQYQNKCKLECQIKEMQSHIDCLKAELAEIQMKKQEVDTELKAERTKNNYLNHVVENLNDISRRLRDENEKLQVAETQKQVLPEEPIRVADMLIYSTDTYTDFLGKKQEYKVYDKSDLKQIAEHLLVYCNHAEV